MKVKLEPGEEKQVEFTLTAQDFIDVVRLHAEDGVDFVTLHCGITRKTIDRSASTSAR